MAIAWLFRQFQQFDGILNRTLDSVEHTDDTLTFWFEDGTGARYDVEGDCCSHSWIEHVTIPDGIRGNVIRDVKQADMQEPFDHGHDNEDEWGNYIQVYANAFVTDVGEIIFEYRNSSNGYYGGFLRGPVEISREA